MGKGDKKQNSKKSESSDDFEISKKTKYMSYFLLGIMLFSVLGFAFISSGGNFGSDGSGERDIPLQADVFQNSQTGETYWGAYLNGERFVFTNGVEGFDERYDMANLSSKIKNKNYVNVYVSENYMSSDAVYLVEKALNAKKIAHDRVVGNFSCSSSTLVFTYNDSDINGECMKFLANQGEEFREAEVLVYHLIK